MTKSKNRDFSYSGFMLPFAMVEEGLYMLAKQRFDRRTDLPAGTPLGQLPSSDGGRSGRS